MTLQDGPRTESPQVHEVYRSMEEGRGERAGRVEANPPGVWICTRDGERIRYLSIAPFQERSSKKLQGSARRGN